MDNTDRARQCTRALRILAGCPTGATYHAMLANGIAPETLIRLELLGLIDQCQQSVRSNCGTIRLDVTRVSINGSGKALLARGTSPLPPNEPVYKRPGEGR